MYFEKLKYSELRGMTDTACHMERKRTFEVKEAGRLWKDAQKH
jgi:hypothetical protein